MRFQECDAMWYGGLYSPPPSCPSNDCPNTSIHALLHSVYNLPFLILTPTQMLISAIGELPTGCTAFYYTLDDFFFGLTENTQPSKLAAIVTRV
jgi:hypothetical protein